MALHHYVPRCVLRGFCASGLGPGKTYVLDKKSGKCVPRSIKSYFAIDDFYEAPEIFPDVNVENWFDREVENGVGEILARWRRDNEPSLPSAKEVEALLSLLASQMMRTPGRILREQRNIADMFNHFGKSTQPTELDKDPWQKEAAALFAIASQERLLMSFGRMDFAVMWAPEGYEYVMGDDPVQTIQTIQRDIATNVTFSFNHSWPGAVTVLPVSKSICLCLYCPTQRRERKSCRFVGIHRECESNMLIINTAQYDGAVRYLASSSKSALAKWTKGRTASFAVD